MSHAVLAEASALVTCANDTRSENAIQNLVHELRQPLSTIEALAYYLEITLPADQFEARRYLTRVRDMVEQSNLILKNAVGGNRRTEPEIAGARA